MRHVRLISENFIVGRLILIYGYHPYIATMIQIALLSQIKFGIFIKADELNELVDQVLNQISINKRPLIDLGFDPAKLQELIISS